MSDTPNTTTPEAIDPLSTNVGDIDLSYPIIPASNYEMSCNDPKVEENKAKTGQNLILKWKNTKEIRSTKGEVLAPNAVVITQYIGLTPSDKRTSTFIAKDLARVAKGCGLPASITPRDIINNCTMLAGKTALVKVAVRSETSEYPESNEIKGVVIEG